VFVSFRRIGGRKKCFRANSQADLPEEKGWKPPERMGGLKAGVVAHAYNPSYRGGVNRRIMVQARLNKNTTPYSKNNESRNDWSRGSSGKTPA
jgi:hypothetical protein